MIQLECRRWCSGFILNARGVVEQLPLPLSLTSAAAEWPRLVIVWGTFTRQ